LVGVCSFLLIAYWYSRIQANKSAIKAILMNRIGDWGYSIGLYIIYTIYGNWNLSLLHSFTPTILDSIISIITICLLIGAMGKSAQLGLHTWLADAMEGLFCRALLKFHCMREHPLNIWSTQTVFFRHIIECNLLIPRFYNIMICLLGKILMFGLFAGNHKGSSETICDTLIISKKHKIAEIDESCSSYNAHKEPFYSHNNKWDSGNF